MKITKKRLLISGVCFAVLGVAVANAMLATPAPKTDYVGLMNQYKDSNEPAGEAAWPIYRAAIADHLGIDNVLADYSPEAKALLDSIPKGGVAAGSLDDPRFAAALSALPAMEPMLLALERAAEAPRLGKAYARVGDALVGEQDSAAIVPAIDVLLPELSPLRNLTRLNVISMRVSAGEGDWDTFARRAKAGVALGEHTMRAGVLIETLVGIAMAAATLDEIRAELNEHDMPAEVAVRLDGMLDVDVRSSLHHAAELEDLLTESVLEFIYDPSGELVLYEMDRVLDINYSGYGKFGRLMNVTTYFFPRLARTQRDLENHTRRFRSYIDRAWETTAVEAEDSVGVLMPGNEVLDQLTPALERAVRVGLRFERDIRATRIMLRLEAIHEESGVLPVTLEAAGLAELNIDPLTGQPFVYVPSPDRESGRVYTLHAPETAWDHLGGDDFTAPRKALRVDPDDLPMN